MCEGFVCFKSENYFRKDIEAFSHPIKRTCISLVYSFISEPDLPHTDFSTHYRSSKIIMLLTKSRHSCNWTHSGNICKWVLHLFRTSFKFKCPRELKINLVTCIFVILHMYLKCLSGEKENLTDTMAIKKQFILHDRRPRDYFR